MKAVKSKLFALSTFKTHMLPIRAFHRIRTPTLRALPFSSTPTHTDHRTSRSPRPKPRSSSSNSPSVKPLPPSPLQPWLKKISWDAYFSDEVTKGNKQILIQRYDEDGYPVGEAVSHEEDRVILFENGTIVECAERQQATTTIAVVLDTVLYQNKLQLRLISPEGTISYVNPNRVSFAFQHRCVDPTWISLCGPADIEDRSDRVNYRVAISKAARTVLKDTERYRSTLDPRMAFAWEKLRAKDESSRRLLTTKEIVMEMMKDHPGGQKEDLEVMYYAIHRYLITCPERFICEEMGQWKGVRWWLRSKVEVEETEKVKDWVRTNHENVSDFITKCTTLIDYSRPALFAMPPAPEDHVLPSFLPSNSSLPTFTPSDLIIISHIQRAFSVSTRQTESFAATVPILIKRTHRYGEIVDREVLRQFLVEIGVRTEWDDIAALSSSIQVVQDLGLGKGERRPSKMEMVEGEDMLDGESTGLLADPDSLNAIGRSIGIELEAKEPNPAAPSTPSISSSSSTSTILASVENIDPKPPSSRATHTASTPLGPDDYYPSDPLSHLRHDFGDLPVFVIDDPNAFELDDGISIEPSRPGFCWIHVHIADPTSLLPPSHRISRAAQRMGQTLYLPQGNKSLLPDEVSVDRFSLGGKGLDPIRGQPVLTFSAEVDEKSGDMVDYKVRAGIVRNVKVTSYAAVNNVFHCKNVQPTFPLGLTHVRPKPGKPKSAEVGWYPELNHLFKTSEAIAVRRLKKGGLTWSLPDYVVSLNPSPPPSLPLEPTPTPKFTTGSPVVEYIVYPSNNLAHNRAQLIVHSCMTLAGNVAGRFFADRRLPAPYRSSPSPRAASQSALETLLETRKSITGEVSPYDVAKLGIIFVGGRLSMVPESHWMMGIEAENGGYVRVTSPLRRFADILAHWQIKNALLFETNSTSAVNPASSFKNKGMLWNPTEMEELSSSVELTVSLGTNVQARSKAFWGTYALQRYARREDPSINEAEDFPPPIASTFALAPSAVTARLGPYEASYVLRSSVVTRWDASLAAVLVVIPALGLRVQAFHPAKDVYEPGERVSVLLDRFKLGPESSITGLVVG